MRGMDLTAKQEKFAQHYAVNHDGAAAYRHAYAVNPATKQATVQRQASALLANLAIAARVEHLRNATPGAVEAMMTCAEAHKAWLDIATADPRELIGLRVGCCRYCHGVGHAYQWRQREYLEAVRHAEKEAKAGRPCDLPDPSGGLDFRSTRPPVEDCPECDGRGEEYVQPRDTNNLSPQALLLYGGVKRKRDGSIEIVMADRQKALEMACRVAGVFDDKVRVSGAISTMGKIVQLQTKDPQEAARMYQELMASAAVAS